MKLLEKSCRNEYFLVLKNSMFKLRDVILLNCLLSFVVIKFDKLKEKIKTPNYFYLIKNL